jgi:hypothetical protein
VSERDEGVPDLDEIKQGEQEARDRRRPFAKGRVRHPAGRRAALRAGRRGLPRLLDGEPHGIDAQGRLAGACRRSGGIAALSRPYRCAVPFYAPSMRAISKTGCGNWRNTRRRAAKIRRLFATIGRRGSPRPLAETSGGPFYLDCRVGRNAATSPGLRSILSTSLA